MADALWFFLLYVTFTLAAFTALRLHERLTARRETHSKTVGSE